MVTGTEQDLRTVETVLAQLQPCCPRCGRAGGWPITWGEMVIWFECGDCYKLWHEDVERKTAGCADA